MRPTLAIAASARSWPDRVHRFLLDHGGGQVIDRVMSVEQALSAQFDVLLIDDICSFLTPSLVRSIKVGGSEVIGVFSPGDGTDAKRRLLECGISDVIETEAGPEEFMELVVKTMAHRTMTPPDFEPSPGGGTVVGVLGATAGVGITEIAIGVAVAASDSTPTVLVDLDTRWPGVAQRLDLAVHPNLRTAVDLALHELHRIQEATHRVGSLAVVGGTADWGRGDQVSRVDALALLEAFTSEFPLMVLDLGPLADVPVGLLRDLDGVIFVASSDPVGVTRAIRGMERVATAGIDGELPLVALNAVRAGYRRREAEVEIRRALPEVTVVTIPHDRRLVDASWNGTTESSRSFRRAMRSIAAVAVGAVS